MELLLLAAAALLLGKARTPSPAAPRSVAAGRPSSGADLTYLETQTPADAPAPVRRPPPANLGGPIALPTGEVVELPPLPAGTTYDPQGGALVNPKVILDPVEVPVGPYRGRLGTGYRRIPQELTPEQAARQAAIENGEARDDPGDQQGRAVLGATAAAADKLVPGTGRIINTLVGFAGGDPVTPEQVEADNARDIAAAAVIVDAPPIVQEISANTDVIAGWQPPYNPRTTGKSVTENR